MPFIRARDARALAFCMLTIPLVYFAASRLLDGGLATAATTGAYACLVLTRPRMIRVYRRLAGQRLERSSYYRN